MQPLRSFNALSKSGKLAVGAGVALAGVVALRAAAHAEHPGRIGTTVQVASAHAKAARDDVKKEAGELGAVMRQHMQEARRDVAQTRKEMSAAMHGAPIDTVIVRDTPPVAANAEDAVRDVRLPRAGGGGAQVPAGALQREPTEARGIAEEISRRDTGAYVAERAAAGGGMLRHALERVEDTLGVPKVQLDADDAALRTQLMAVPEYMRADLKDRLTPPTPHREMETSGYSPRAAPAVAPSRVERSIEERGMMERGRVASPPLAANTTAIPGAAREPLHAETIHSGTAITTPNAGMGPGARAPITRDVPPAPFTSDIPGASTAVPHAATVHSGTAITTPPGGPAAAFLARGSARDQPASPFTMPIPGGSREVPHAAGVHAGTAIGMRPQQQQQQQPRRGDALYGPPGAVTFSGGAIPVPVEGEAPFGIPQGVPLAEDVRSSRTGQRPEITSYSAGAVGGPVAPQLIPSPPASAQRGAARPDIQQPEVGSFTETGPVVSTHRPASVGISEAPFHRFEGDAARQWPGMTAGEAEYLRRETELGSSAAGGRIAGGAAGAPVISGGSGVRASEPVGISGGERDEGRMARRLEHEAAYLHDIANRIRADALEKQQQAMKIFGGKGNGNGGGNGGGGKQQWTSPGAASGGGGGASGVTRRAATAAGVMKAHGSAAAEDVSKAATEARDVLSVHGRQAKADIGQMGAEVKQALTGDVLPGRAVVRRTPDLLERLPTDAAEAIPTPSTGSMEAQASPGIVDRVKEASSIVASHVSAGASDVAQAAREVTGVTKEHAVAAGRDQRQQGREVAGALRGERLEAARVRDVQPVLGVGGRGQHTGRADATKTERLQ